MTTKFSTTRNAHAPHRRLDNRCAGAYRRAAGSRFRAGGSVTLVHPGDDALIELAEFRTAKCRKARGARFNAVSKDNAWQVDLFGLIKPNRSRQRRATS